jgi:protein phosphatase
MLTCPQCGEVNRPGANACMACGTDLRAVRAGRGAPPAETGVFQRLRRSLFGESGDAVVKPGAEPAAPDGRAAPNGQAAHAGPAAETGPGAKPAAPLAPPQPGRPLWLAGRYVVLKAYPLPASTYYDALDLLCAICGRRGEPAGAGQPQERCDRCGNLLARRLLHVSQGPEPAMPASTLVQLSRMATYIVAHENVVQSGADTVVALAPPDDWQPLSHLMTVVDFTRARLWVGQLGAAVLGLHQSGATWGADGAALLESVLLVEGGARACLGDLSRCRLLPAGTRGSTHVARDVRFLARALFHMLTRRRLPDQPDQLAGAPVWPAELPRELRAPLAAALADQYQSVEQFIADVQRAGSVLGAARSDGHRLLRQTVGTATHPGRRRTNNEDSLETLNFTRQVGSLTVPIGVYVVADGVGGQAAGEVASETARRTVTQWIARALRDPLAETGIIYDTPGALLAGAIEAANRVVFQTRTAQQSNMGTTVTAALVIADQAYVGNVGDSRTYLLRAGRLRQITADHSFTANLVSAGAITPEQARTHPQRTILLRALGEQPAVEVDVFAERLAPGDRLVLCSDGLWEMVGDEAIATTLAGVAEPQAACEALVAAANEAGGYDNVSVVVVAVDA